MCKRNKVTIQMLHSVLKIEAINVHPYAATEFSRPKELSVLCIDRLSDLASIILMLLCRFTLGLCEYAEILKRLPQ